jgi:L-fuculose-phosphate aldolase
VNKQLSNGQPLIKQPLTKPLSTNQLLTKQHLRDAVVAAGQFLRAQGLTAAKSGNVSVRCEGGMFITPSGLSYDDLTADLVVFVSDAGEAVGELAPSSEWRFHHDIYQQRPELMAVVHTHSLYCTALACTRRSIPAFHYMVAAAGGNDIRCADYHTFGTQSLSDAVLLAMEDRRACLLANHGMIASGANIEQALQLAEELEALAGQYCEVLKIGGGVILSEAEMQAVHEKFAHYGQVVPAK